jgi:MarR family
VARSGDLGTLMRTGYHRTMEYVQARLEQLGFDDVRPAHMAIFQNLGPEGARIGELAERAKLTNQSVGYLVDYLEEHGYVERRPDATNRRATLVCFMGGSAPYRTSSKRRCSTARSAPRASRAAWLQGMRSQARSRNVSRVITLRRSHTTPLCGQRIETTPSASGRRRAGISTSGPARAPVTSPASTHHQQRPRSRAVTSRPQPHRKRSGMPLQRVQAGCPAAFK